MSIVAVCQLRDDIVIPYLIVCKQDHTVLHHFRTGYLVNIEQISANILGSICLIVRHRLDTKCWSCGGDMKGVQAAAEEGEHITTHLLFASSSLQTNVNYVIMSIT
jgi:hypothetical protein